MCWKYLNKMYYSREGFPSEDEIVLCKVTKIFPNSIFVELMEYKKQGMIHISEVSPGRIRNLRDYVSVGRQIVCKILKINREKGFIDLSLRRVNSHQRQAKLDEIKQEQKSEQLIQNLAKKLKKNPKELYENVSKIIFKEYSHLADCFKEVVSNEINLEELGIEKKIAKEMTEAILEKFKPQKISIQGEINIQTYDTLGIEKVKKTLLNIEKISDTISLAYLGGGRYRFIIEDIDYKPAEKNLKKVNEILEKFNDKNSTATFTRKD